MKKSLSRRDFLKLAGTGLGGIVLGGAKLEAVRASSDGQLPPEEHKALLYDATRCIGCRVCENACRQYNGLPDEQADDLTGENFTVIKRYESEDGTLLSHRKYQCMHCVEPACASACPVGALHKLEDGPVAYDNSKCIGCRYCMQACAFGVPRYDWSLAYPLIRKCELCYHREGGPACAEVCPKQAVIFGGRFEWIVGHSIGLGFGGNGFINEFHYEPALSSDVFLTGGYGGFYIEPIVMPNFPVHLAFPILLGGGGQLGMKKRGFVEDWLDSAQKDC